MAQITSMRSLRMGDGNAHSGNITNSFNNIVYNSDEDAQIMYWLSPFEPNNRHKDVRTERFDGVGDWFLEGSEFREWRSGEGGADKAVLFCGGNPGVGKTYLSSLVIDSLCDQEGKADATIAGLYCDYLSQQEQTVTNMMGAIIRQLLGREGIPDYLREEFQEAKNKFGGRRLRLPDLVRILGTTIASLPRVFICIDALDEVVPKHLLDLLGSLKDVVRESPRTRIFLTGRPHVRDDILRYFSEALVIPISPNRDDIRSYLEMRLDRDAEPEAMNDGLRADIIRIILQRISDIFLLVSLNIDAILGEVTIHQRRKKLENMTQGNGLSDAYTATLTRLKAQKGYKSILGLKVLMWVLCSERPLRVEELRHALGVEMGSADLVPENVPALRTLLASSLGLVIVEASSSAFRLVHFTLQEHLSSNPTLFRSPHSEIAEVCLTYLNFGFVRSLSPTLLSAPSTTPLLEYASCYWGDHAKRGMTENVKILALRLLDGFDKHISAQLMLLHYSRGKGWYDAPYFSGTEGPRGFTGLHGIAFLGMVEIFAAVLEMKGWDVNATDCMGSTALTWAAGGGHEGVVEMLLEQEDINPNMADTEYGRTPLCWAAQSGHEGVVEMLFEREDVDPNTADTGYGQTPLFWAAEGGHGGVVKLLLERGDVNPNTADTKYGRTPLSWAARSGDEVVVKLLLERGDVNPNTADTEYGRIPLCWAAQSWRVGIVKLLLERGDVNPNTADTKYGRTPLCWAARSGDEVVVKLLLEREDINPNMPDTQYGRTPLCWAAKNGHEGVVKLLLEREDVNPNTADTKYGQTPLCWAARSGHKGVVKLLLERDDVNPNMGDTKYSQTPLRWATECKHEGVVKLLLEREDVDPNTADTKCGWTPLCLAAKRGHEGLVKLLLERKDVNPNTVDTKYSQTPLCWATECGYEEVVKMLLEREDVDPNTADAVFDRTPLCRAIQCGHEGVVRVLLEREGINPNTADTKYGETPLFLAAQCGREGVVKMLLEQESISLNAADTTYGRTPLYRAVQCGNEGVVKMLLEREDADPNTADTECGETPLCLAAQRGRERVAKMLLERKDINPNTPDTKCGRTPLSWAAGQGNEGVVKMLLERKDVYTTLTDNKGLTALSRALSRRHNGVVRILLNRDNVYPSTTDRTGYASLPPSAG